MTPMSFPDTDAALARIRSAAAKGRRSSLYLWMLDHRAEFADAIAAAGRPNWKELAKTFHELGLTDRLGHPPSPEGARQTWVLVRKAIAGAAAPKRTLTPTTATTTRTVSASPVTVRSPIDDTEDEPEPIIIRPVTRK
jgi:hypothetical protein